jgi:hypothetical protein
MSMADDDEARFRQHEAIMEGLARMLAAQYEMNQRVEGFIQEQREFNARQVAINERLEVTQAHIETLLARMLSHGENRQEA